MTTKQIENPLINFLLQLGDNALIMGHRNSEWCGHGPVLEQDIALTNIALDQIGQARNFYQYAATLISETSGEKLTEDSLAYLRDSWDFKNCLLTELPNGHWGQTILKQFFVSTYQYYLYQELEINSDLKLAGIASKSLKEINYHVRWSSEWVLRLGDGTSESKQKMLAALETLWPYLNEWTIFTDYEIEILGNKHQNIKEKWEEKIHAVLNEAGLIIPSDVYAQRGGKQGNHTEHLGYILAEMQFLQRAYPNSEW
ncbi:MAG: 1,2-phenylacetyl-CoA epoxidase subunit PaaC [Bacteroidota bacterium]